MARSKTPWVISRARLLLHIVSPAERRTVCTFGCVGAHENAEDDARLCVAAPEMFDAIGLALGLVDRIERMARDAEMPAHLFKVRVRELCDEVVNVLVNSLAKARAA